MGIVKERLKQNIQLLELDYLS